MASSSAKGIFPPKVFNTTQESRTKTQERAAEREREKKQILNLKSEEDRTSAAVYIHGQILTICSTLQVSTTNLSCPVGRVFCLCGKFLIKPMCPPFIGENCIVGVG